METKDISSEADIELLVNTFYSKVRSNSVLGPIFSDVAKIDWEHHLPKMYSFWSGILLGNNTYTGNPITKHVSLSQKTTMSEIEFAEWLLLFTKTVDELFVGEKAEEAKSRAANISRLMHHKITEAANCNKFRT